MTTFFGSSLQELANGVATLPVVPCQEGVFVPWKQLPPWTTHLQWDEKAIESNICFPAAVVGLCHLLQLESEGVQPSPEAALRYAASIARALATMPALEPLSIWNLVLRAAQSPGLRQWPVFFELWQISVVLSERWPGTVSDASALLDLSSVPQSLRGVLSALGGPLDQPCAF